MPDLWHNERFRSSLSGGLETRANDDYSEWFPWGRLQLAAGDEGATVAALHALVASGAVVVRETVHPFDPSQYVRTYAAVPPGRREYEVAAVSDGSDALARDGGAGTVAVLEEVVPLLA
jgi:hypothetical protein